PDGQGSDANVLPILRRAGVRTRTERRGSRFVHPAPCARGLGGEGAQSGQPDRLEAGQHRHRPFHAPALRLRHLPQVSGGGRPEQGQQLRLRSELTAVWPPAHLAPSTSRSGDSRGRAGVFLARGGSNCDEEEPVIAHNVISVLPSYRLIVLPSSASQLPP